MAVKFHAGGIIGGSLTAGAPDFTQAHLGVPAMNYSTLLQRSIDFDTYAQIMYRAYPNVIERQMALSLIQMVWDRAESNGHAHHMTTDRTRTRRRTACCLRRRSGITR